MNIKYNKNMNFKVAFRGKNDLNIKYNKNMNFKVAFRGKNDLNIKYNIKLRIFYIIQFDF